jgi:ABC-type Fe3+ transport system permease subunit
MEQPRPSAKESIHLYLPLMIFLIPTLVIGFGVLIPRSCIAGWNQLSIGFGMTVLFASITYVRGIRLALRRERRSPLINPL